MRILLETVYHNPPRLSRRNRKFGGGGGEFFCLDRRIWRGFRESFPQRLDKSPRIVYNGQEEIRRMSGKL